METHKRIYNSLVKRDSREKQVALVKVIQANDALITCVETLKTDLDDVTYKLERSKAHGASLQQRINELEKLLRMKDDIISRLSSVRK